MSQVSYSAIVISLVVCLLFGHISLYAHDFDGRTHIHYKINLSPIILVERLQNSFEKFGWKYTTHRYSIKYTDSTNIIKKANAEELIVLALPQEDSSKIRTRIYFRVLHDSTTILDFIIYKKVSKGKKFWAWGIHNPFGLFDFGTKWESEPKDTPFTKEQLSVIFEILKNVEKPD